MTQSAIDRGVDEAKLLNPAKANEPEFLETLAKMNLDLCVTAAYGNFLPQKFLDIPRLGTLNIHPSLLPQFRGAAPVQRCIESGLEETGVTVAFTVLKMDAGPILTQTKYRMNGSEKAHEMLDVLFDIGVESLIEQLPKVFTGEAGEIAKDQGEEGLSHADKVSSEEGDLDFSALSALEEHNKVRAFDGWPGTKATFIIQDEKKGGEPKEIVAKILTTKVGGSVEGGEKSRKSREETVFSIPCKGRRISRRARSSTSGKETDGRRVFREWIKTVLALVCLRFSTSCTLFISNKINLLKYFANFYIYFARFFCYFSLSLFNLSPRFHRSLLLLLLPHLALTHECACVDRFFHNQGTIRSHQRFRRRRRP